jgi:hypothetical protein
VTRVATANMLHVGDLLFEHGRPSGRVIEIERAEDRTLHARVGPTSSCSLGTRPSKSSSAGNLTNPSWYCAAEGCLQQPAVNSTLCYYHQKNAQPPAVGREPSVFDEVTRETRRQA